LLYHSSIVVRLVKSKPHTLYHQLGNLQCFDLNKQHRGYACVDGMLE